MPHGFVAQTWLAGVCLSLWLMVAAVPGHASRFLDPNDADHMSAIRGLEALHAGDPQRANRFLTEYIMDSPEDPLGPLLRMKLSWWGILEGRDQDGALDRRLKGDLRRVQSTAEKRLKHDRNDVRALFALGEAYCTYGRLQGLKGAGWATLQNHRKGTPLLERALEIEPDLVEPLASLGVFHYYASRAPRFLRFLARFFSVEADRQKGLQQLFEAAQGSGVQQAEAAFFLLEILVNVEDDQLAALPLALRFHQHYPRNLGFKVSLASVQIALGQPDQAASLLRQMWRDEDPVHAIAARFFLARSLVMTGRPAEALELLDGFETSEFNRVTWLRAWHSYYLGLAYEQLGRANEAQHAFEVTRAIPMVADSHGYAQRALSRRPGALQVVLRDAEASLAWNLSNMDLRQRLEQALASDSKADRELRRRAQYAHALLSLREGDFVAAADALRPLVKDADCDEAWLVVRPRIRLLQALLWSGRLDDARSVALELQPKLESWGSNRQLAEMVENCRDPHPQPHGFPDGILGAGETARTFRVKDSGFTSVHLRFEGQEGTSRMRLRGDLWEVQVALEPGNHLYHFVVEESLVLPDPSNLRFLDHAGLPWSVLHVETDPQELQR